MRSWSFNLESDRFAKISSEDFNDNSNFTKFKQSYLGRSFSKAWEITNSALFIIVIPRYHTIKDSLDIDYFDYN